MSKCLLVVSTARRSLAIFCLGLTYIQYVATCPAQSTTSPSLPPGVQDVVKLVKAGLNEDVVMAQIKHVAASYNLSADQIIYLHDQGVSQNEIAALMGSGAPTPSASPVPVTPPSAPLTSPGNANAPPPPVPSPATPIPAPPAISNPNDQVPQPPSADPQNLEAFRGQLAPYGTWTDSPGYGLCWRPSVEATDPFWQPYCNSGRWLYTPDGWSWQSDYPWGNVVFHYGRWYRDGLGWVWVPGYDWAPAWVCWRQADGYCGWAPLPPAAIFKPGIGLWFGGRAAVEVDFDLHAEAFTFVSYDHFWDHDFHAFLLPRERIRLVFGRSVIMNGYRVDHGRFIVEGLGRERMAALTHHEIRVEHEVAHEFVSRRQPEHGVAREERKDRKDR